MKKCVSVSKGSHTPALCTEEEWLYIEQQWEWYSTIPLMVERKVQYPEGHRFHPGNWQVHLSKPHPFNLLSLSMSLCMMNLLKENKKYCKIWKRKQKTKRIKERTKGLRWRMWNQENEHRWQRLWQRVEKMNRWVELILLTWGSGARPIA